MRRFFGTYRLVSLLVTFAGLAGLIIIGYVIPAETAPVLVPLLLSWAALMIAGLFMVRWRFTQRA